MKRIGYKTLILLFVLAAFPVAYDLWPKLQLINPRATPFLILKYIPVLLLVTAGVLGFRLNQIKILLVSLLVLLIYLLKMGIAMPRDFVHPADLSLLLSVTVPLSVSLLLLFDESRMFSRLGLTKIAICFFPTILLLIAVHWDSLGVPRALAWTPFPRLPSRWISHFTALPLLALLAEGLLFRERLARTLLIVFGFFLVPFYYELTRHPVRLDLTCVTYICGSVMVIYLVMRQFWLNSYIDDLTEVPNRRALEENLKLLPKRWCLAMVDIDHFKKFNDRYGHQAGDHVLRMVAAALDRAPHGQVYRYGGEEFTILYKGCDIYEVGEYVDELVDTICRRNFTIRRPDPERKRTSAKDRGRRPVAPEKRVRVTISIGATERREDERNPHLVIERADKALYRAKKKGRNCAIVVE